MSTLSAVVYKYPDDTHGWVIRWGDTDNQEVNDISTEVLVPLNNDAEPVADKPLWKQVVVDGDFENASSEIKDDAKVWLAEKFVRNTNVLWQTDSPLVITDQTTFPVVIGEWITDSRGGVEEEDDQGRVFGAIFYWDNPVDIRPPVLTCKSYNPAGELKNTLSMFGEAIKTKNDVNKSYEFWKMVTGANIPNTFRRWELELDVPTLEGGEACTLRALRLARGKRGAD